MNLVQTNRRNVSKVLTFWRFVFVYGIILALLIMKRCFSALKLAMIDKVIFIWRYRGISQFRNCEITVEKELLFY